MLQIYKQIILFFGEVFSKTYGHNSVTKADLDSDKEYPSIFYSSTKLVAKMLGMMMWERNIIDMDEPVWKYLPEYHSDNNVANESSVYPLHVLRPIPTDAVITNNKVTVRGTEYDVHTHNITQYIHNPAFGMTTPDMSFKFT